MRASLKLFHNVIERCYVSHSKALNILILEKFWNGAMPNYFPHLIDLKLSLNFCLFAKISIEIFKLIPFCLRIQSQGTGSRFSACSFIKMLFFCRDMLYRLFKQYDYVIMLSKNQSAHTPGSHLINLCANSCKLINHGIKPSDQQ